MPNPFCHIELTTDDLKAAQKFYGKVFAWKLTDFPGMSSYTMIDVGGGTGGGMQTPPMPEAPRGWMPYVEVSDVKAAVAKAAKAGAKVFVPYQEIPGGMGALGVFADPLGSMIGVWEPSKSAPAAPPPKKVVAKKAAKKAAAPAKQATKKTVAPAKPSAPTKKAPAKKAAPAPAKNAAPAKKKRK